MDYKELADVDKFILKALDTNITIACESIFSKFPKKNKVEIIGRLLTNEF